MLKAVIYDLDGTLIDSREDLAAAVNAALAQVELPAIAQAQLIEFIGGGAERLVRRSLAAALGAVGRDSASEALVAKTLAAWHHSYAQGLLVKTQLYPGIAELLAMPPPARAVLTNKPGGYARSIVEGLGIASAFAKVIGGDEVPRKPDPTALLQLCKALGASANETLYVGDMAIDVETARAGGVPVCAVSWGLGKREDLVAAQPQHLVDSASEFVRLLERL